MFLSGTKLPLHPLSLSHSLSVCDHARALPSAVLAQLFWASFRCVPFQHTLCFLRQLGKLEAGLQHNYQSTLSAVNELREHKPKFQFDSQDSCNPP